MGLSTDISSLRSPKTKVKGGFAQSDDVYDAVSSYHFRFCRNRAYSSRPRKTPFGILRARARPGITGFVFILFFLSLSLILFFILSFLSFPRFLRIQLRPKTSRSLGSLRKNARLGVATAAQRAKSQDSVSRPSLKTQSEDSVSRLSLKTQFVSPRFLFLFETGEQICSRRCIAKPRTLRERNPRFHSRSQARGYA